jgi:hypothetical protein
MSKVFVKYGFIFDPNRTWDTLHSFERDLANAFSQKGFKTELIETGSDNDDMVILSVEPAPGLGVDDKPVEFKEKDLKDGKSVSSNRSKHNS